MNYLYNGVELPDINEVWTDKETYPYAVIYYYDAGMVDSSLAGQKMSMLLLISVQGYYTGGYAVDGSHKSKSFGVADSQEVADVFGDITGVSIPVGVWGFATEEETTDDLTYDEGASFLWSNHDILNTDGTTYLAASEPIPVGSEPATDLKPIYKRINGQWVKQTAYERQNGQWVLISSVEQPDVPTGIYDDTEPLAWNSLAVTNNGAKFTYQGTPMVKISNLFGDAYDFNKYNILNIITGGMTFTATLQGTQNIDGCIGGVYIATLGSDTAEILVISVPQAGTYADIDIPEKGIYVTDYGALMPDDSIDFESTTGGIEVTDEYIKWYGNTDGLECAELGMIGNLYKVSEEVPTEYAENYTKVVYYDYAGTPGQYTSDDSSWNIDEEDGLIAINLMYAVIVLEEGVTYYDASLSPGVWFSKMPTNDFYVTELHFET